MSHDALKTLFHPFVSAMITSPSAEKRILFLGAKVGFTLPEEFQATIVAAQGFRPFFLQLQAQRLNTISHIEGVNYDGALILCTKHKNENEVHIAEALNRVKKNGLIVVAGAKEDGILSLRKKMAIFDIKVDYMSKYHGIVFWFNRPQNAVQLTAQLMKFTYHIDNYYMTMPGMFSHGRIDAGSKLLASCLPSGFIGDVADFGAGWGYLAVEMGLRSPRLGRIDLYEANYAALEISKTNVASNIPNITTHFFWHDLIVEKVRNKYDLIIMNPPFHEGRTAKLSLGKAMVRTAASSIRSGGQLFMVANHSLSYEPLLAELFKRCSEICRNARFKVLAASKPFTNKASKGLVS